MYVYVLVALSRVYVLIFITKWIMYVYVLVALSRVYVLILSVVLNSWAVVRVL